MVRTQVHNRQCERLGSGEPLAFQSLSLILRRREQPRVVVCVRKFIEIQAHGSARVRERRRALGTPLSKEEETEEGSYRQASDQREPGTLQDRDQNTR